MTNNIYLPVARDEDTGGEALIATQKLSDGSHALATTDAPFNAGRGHA
jgi:hypothetical protein